MRVIVVGGGIGGAAAALALTLEGVDVTLLEQAPVLAEVGAGLQINANGTRALRHLGVLDEFDALAVEAEAYRIMQFETGELVHEQPLGAASTAHFGGKSYEAHRADLLDCLVRALPDGVVRTGARCRDVEQGDGAVTVPLESGERVTGDIVVGADGIHSAVRDSVFGPAESFPTGTAAWRALIPADKIADLNLRHRFHGWRGRDRIAIGYWARAGEVFNFAVFVPDGELKRESWSQKGDHGDLKRAMEGAAPLLTELVSRAEDNFISALHYYKPLPAWTRGRVTLMGDSAHAVLPYMHQGANLALEDAVVLGRVIGRAAAEGSDVTTALMRYERLRKPRASKIQADVLALAGFWFASDPVHRMAGMYRMHAQDRDDPMADSQWGYVYSYDPVLEADHGDVRRHPAMSVSRAVREPAWPPMPAARQRWARIFDFDSLAGGYQSMRARYEEHFAAADAVDAGARPVTLGGVPALSAGEAAASTRDTGPVILHVHGGGYVLGSARASVPYASALAGAAGGAAIALDHRLAPEHPWPAPVEDLLAAYAALTGSGTPADRIVLSGESSGAAVVLSALVRLRDDGQPLPAGALLVSPFADLTLSSESMTARGFADEFLTKDQFRYWSTSYTQAHDPAKGDVSPVFADLSGLPPLVLLAARDEAVASDAVRIADAAAAAGGVTRLVLAPTATHSYPVFTDEPASAASIALLGASAARMASGPGALRADDPELLALARAIADEEATADDRH